MKTKPVHKTWREARTDLRLARDERDAMSFRALMAAVRKTGQITMTMQNHIKKGSCRLFWGANNKAATQHLDGPSVEACVNALTLG